MTYHLAVMWLWAGALGATLAGLVLVVRALARADAAVVALRGAVEAVDPVGEAGAALQRATGEAAHQRAALGRRTTPAP